MAHPEIRLRDFPDTPFLIHERDKVFADYISETGGWETDLVRYAASLLPERARIVVGGGHVGLVAFQLWKARPDIAEMVLFEPDSLNVGLLALNVQSWGDSPVRVMPMALGKQSGDTTLARSPYNTGDSRLWDQIPEENDGNGPWIRTDVLVVALDDVWHGPLDLILLDVQGWEPEVLAGAVRTIREQKPTIIFEWWPAALAARGVDGIAVLDWLERKLRLQIDVTEFTNAIEAAKDPRELTRQISHDQNLFAELVARPRESSALQRLFGRARSSV